MKGEFKSALGSLERSAEGGDCASIGVCQQGDKVKTQKTYERTSERTSEPPDSIDELQICPRNPNYAPIELKRGGIYLICGRNRSGKSTLVKVLCKTLIPQKHCDITLNGKPFQDVDRVELRHAISYVAQRPFIFEGTIAENISLGRVPCDADAVETAAQLAGVFVSEKPKRLNDLQEMIVARRRRRALAQPWRRRPPLLQWAYSRVGAALQWARRMTHGLLDSDPKPVISPEPCGGGISLDTAAEPQGDAKAAAAEPATPKTLSRAHKREILKMHTNTRGTNLSGGFSQSVALARVFLRQDAQLVILDEGLSQMDAIKRHEHVMPNLLQHVKAHNITLILISHDVKSVCRQVDRIFVMDQGRCVHQGSHQDLIRSKAKEYLRLLGDPDGSASDGGVDGVAR